jgi:hypothetical protein
MFILRRLFWAQRRRPTSRYSYIQAGGFPTTVEIRQTLAYGDGSAPFSTGRATNWTTQFYINNSSTAAETYAQSFSYDSLGNLATLCDWTYSFITAFPAPK